MSAILKITSSSAITNHNSNLLANTMNINVANDAAFKGATVRADETLNLTVGNNLNVESLRDSYSSNSNGFNVSAGISSSTTAKTSSSGANASLGTNTGRTLNKQTVLTSLTGDNVNISVGNDTHLKGSLVAAGSTDENGVFQDNQNLNLSTKTLTFENSTNTNYSSSNSMSVGANANSDKVSSVSTSFSTGMNYERTKTLATLGNGNINITDKENSDDLARLNTDTTQVDKSLFKTSTGTSVSATLDTRLLTAEGRAEIKEEFGKEFDKALNAIDDINRYVKDKVDGYELTEAKKEQIKQTGIKESLVQALMEKGVSQEKIDEILANEKVQTVLAGIQKPIDTKSDTTNNVSQQIGENRYLLAPIGTTPTKNVQDYLVDGAGAMNEIVNIVGEDNAATAILVTQFAIQGTVKTATSMMSDEVKNTIFGGAKDQLGDYIANEYFDIKNEIWSTTQKESIGNLSDASSGFAVDTLISGGAFGIIKSAKNLGSVSDGFEASIGSGTVTNQGVYDSKDIRSSLEDTHGAENVTSTTVPKNPTQATTTRSDVITDSNGNKAVQITMNNGTIKSIPYDSRGLPIFDDVSAFTTTIDTTKSYTGQMKQASLDMWEAIKNDPVAQSGFTAKQLNQIQSGAQKIDNFTWHHNAQSAPNSMQLVPAYIHNEAVPHTGQNALSKGQ